MKKRYSPDLPTVRVSFEFNVKASERAEIGGLAMGYLWNPLLELQPAPYVTSILCHGPVIPKGAVDPRDTLYITVTTTDLPKLEEVIKSKTKIPYRIVPAYFPG